jgi:hypothetical protein
MVAWLLAGIGAEAPEAMAAGGAPPPPRPTPVTTPETAALLARLLALADSARSEDQRELAGLLTQAETLDRLDEPKERDRSRTADLRLAAVVSRLRSNAAPAAATTLATLARSTVYRESWQREELLVRALGTPRPLGPETLSFLDEQARADSVNLHLAVAALCDNGSPEAIALLGQKLADPSLDTVYKLGWFRDPLLRNRRNPEMLRAAARWLARDGLSHDLQIGVADALFDYRPDEWYPGRGGAPRPPDEASTTPDAASALRLVGQTVLDGDYPASIKKAVRRTMGKLSSR